MMKIEIDELSNEVLTDIEISNRVAALIESAYPAGRELKIMRLYLANQSDAQVKAAFDTYNADVEAIRAEGAAARRIAGIVRAAIEWEQAGDSTISVSPEVQAVIDARISARAVPLVDTTLEVTL